MQIRNIHTKNAATGESLWTGIQLIKLAPARRHHFGQAWLDRHIDRGFVTKTDKDITLHTVDGDMKFSVDHVPGRYCLHCNAALPNEDSEGAYPAGHPKLGEAARKHVAKDHKGAKSPNPNHPHGYKNKSYYGATAAEDVPTINSEAKQVKLRVA
jgi:hypothetical protein